MKKTSQPQKVEQLERYGKSLSDVPKEAFKGQGKVIFRMLRKKFGLFGIIPFFFSVMREKKLLLKKYAKEYEDLKVASPRGAKEFSMLVSLFNAIEKKESRKAAHKFVLDIMNSVAVQSLSAIYQLDDLIKCEGDLFDNYKKFNIAMFKAGNADYNVKKIEETENHLRIVVDRCINYDIGKCFNCPEVGHLGCDHDLAAYPYVDPKTNSVFRRPSTLAEGDKFCDFNFYRKGFEPKGKFKNK